MLNIHHSVTIERVTDAVASDDNLGFCIDCGTEHDGCEPDAREYHCDACGFNSVYGAEELLFMLAI